MSLSEPKGLLLFSIGPVQDFIATARRTQDLWMGSYILAYLAYVAMDVIQADAGYKPGQSDDTPDPILFPVLAIHPFPKGKAEAEDREHRRQLMLASLPNKFTAQVDSVEKGRQLAMKAQKRVYDVWLEITNAVQNKILGLLAEGVDWYGMWHEQSDPEKWLEIYWVVCMASQPDIGFGALNEQAERALAARKGVRNFQTVTVWGERDSLSGRRAALSDPVAQSRHLLRQQWRELARALYQKSIKDKKLYGGLSAMLSTEGYEYLSAIDMTKRFAQRFCFQPHWGIRGKFPSTSSLATAVFRQQLLTHDALKAARQTFVATLKRVQGHDKQVIPNTLAKDSLPRLWTDYPNDDPLLAYDGSLFYPETYTARRLKDEFNVTFRETAVRQLHQNLLALRAAAQREKVTMPSTYYALIMMDGDKMGDHLATIQTVSEQRDVSLRLMRFALQTVQGIVEDTYLGRVVYAGGDDLLAFLPLETVLLAAHDLNKAYRHVLNAGGPVQYKASAGIVIAHHLAPLDQVLQVARETEKRAKGWYGRDSVVFSVMKRSGERLEVGSRWISEGVAVLPLIRKVYNCLLDERVALSPRFAFEAEQEAFAMTNMRAAHEKRLAYLLKRHSKETWPEADRVSLAADLAQMGAGLQAQLGQATTQECDADRVTTVSGTTMVARWLLLARFLAAAMAGEV